MTTDLTRATQAPSPFAELATLYQQLERRKLHRTADGSMVGKLLDAARAIEAVQETAAKMQLGAEGFDNTEAAGLYRRVQEHLSAAAKSLVEASAMLKKRAES